LQAADGRVVFAIPFARDFTLIGTTDRSFSGDPAAVAPSEVEIDYLCGVINASFRASIVWRQVDDLPAACRGRAVATVGVLSALAAIDQALDRDDAVARRRFRV
jgi:hypothetical protein